MLRRSRSETIISNFSVNYDIPSCALNVYLYLFFFPGDCNPDISGCLILSDNVYLVTFEYMAPVDVHGMHLSAPFCRFDIASLFFEQYSCSSGSGVWVDKNWSFCAVYTGCSDQNNFQKNLLLCLDAHFHGQIVTQHVGQKQHIYVIQQRLDSFFFFFFFFFCSPYSWVTQKPA
jgi:hypothetical protein